jgi:hypothetical protein
MHSLGVQVFQMQNAHFLQHLQKQQEQQMLIINTSQRGCQYFKMFKFLCLFSVNHILDWTDFYTGKIQVLNG